MPTPAGRPPRRDAVRNREALLAAARSVFGRLGEDAPLEEVARAAAVSRATLYRHFATREDLAVTVYEDNLARIEGRAVQLRDRPDGVVELFDFVLELQLGHRLMARVLSEADAAWLGGLAERAAAAFRPLVETAARAGVLRPEVGVDDVLLAFLLAEAGTDAGLHERTRVLLHRALFAGPVPPAGS